MMPKKAKKATRSRTPRRAPLSVPSQPAQPEGQETAGNDRDSDFSSLTRRQQSTIAVVAASPSIAQAARDSGVSERTLYRWFKEPAFREELANLRVEVTALAMQEFQGLLLRSASVIGASMSDPSPSIRLRAARYAALYGVQAGEMSTLRKDLQRLEKAVDHAPAKSRN